MDATGDAVTGRGRCRRYRACARWRLPRPCDALLLAALTCSPLPALAATGVDIAAAVGFTDTFQPGRWTPLGVTVTNHGGEVTGELEVQVKGGDVLRGRQFVTAYRRSLELPRGSRKTLQFTIRPQGLVHPLVIRVNAGGRELAREEVDLRARFVAERMVVVLSRNADLDYLNASGPDGLRMLYPHPELLPAHWRGYDAVAAVIVHGVSLERLSASQFEALHKWIAQGGILAVSGGADYGALRSPRLAPLLPGVPSGVTRMEDDALKRAFSATLDVSRPVYVNRLGSFRGRARLSAGSVPLVVERGVGLGRVLLLAFDVASYPFDRWDGMRGLWLESLDLPRSTNPFAAVAETTHESPLPLLIRAEAADFPAHTTVLAFLALYLGLLLAGYQLPWRGTWSRRLAPLITWGAPVLFVPAAWLVFGPPAFPRGATAVTVALIEPFPDSIYARLGLDLSAYASRSGTLRLEYRGAEPVLYPPQQSQRAGTAADWVLGEGPRRYAEPLDRRRYVLHALEGEDVIAFHVNAAVHEEVTGPRLVLDNASGRPLEDAWLLHEGYAYQLGSIAAGARLERGFVRAVHGTEAGEAPWRHVMRPSAEPQARSMAPSRIALERRLQATGRSEYPGPGHALLIAHTASPVQPGGASSGWSRRERALVAFRFATAPRHGAAEPAAAAPGAGDSEGPIEATRGRNKAEKISAAGQDK
jgi:hypothetical protein